MNSIVILEYDISFIEFVDDIYFCKYNAARTDMIPSKYRNYSYFNKMFEDEYYTCYDAYLEGNVSIRNRTLPAVYPTHSQAEILVNSVVENKFIKRIIVENNEVYNTICNIRDIDIVVDSNYYKFRDQVYKEVYYGY